MGRHDTTGRQCRVRAKAGRHGPTRRADTSAVMSPAKKRQPTWPDVHLPDCWVLTGVSRLLAPTGPSLIYVYNSMDPPVECHRWARFALRPNLQQQRRLYNN